MDCGQGTHTRERGGGQRDRDRERGRGRQRERQTDRQRQGERDRRRDRETETAQKPSRCRLALPALGGGLLLNALLGPTCMCTHILRRPGLCVREHARACTRAPAAGCGSCPHPLRGPEPRLQGAGGSHREPLQGGGQAAGGSAVSVCLRLGGGGSEGAAAATGTSTWACLPLQWPGVEGGKAVPFPRPICPQLPIRALRPLRTIWSPALALPLPLSRASGKPFLPGHWLPDPCSQFWCPEPAISPGCVRRGGQREATPKAHFNTYGSVLTHLTGGKAKADKGQRSHSGWCSKLEAES